MVKLKIGFFGALFITFPLIAIQIYRFVAPGLYANERNAFRPYLVATPIFFVLGACLVFFFLLPVAIKFFYSLVQGTGGAGQTAVELMPDVRSYLDFVMMLILAFGLCFQLPVILTLLGQIGIVSYEQLKSGRKFAIVGVFIVAAVLTPPDPISQISMAIPLMGLYEISVQAVRFLENRRAAAKAKAEAEEAATSS
jgi:sec-independent protein translocase protein TatC